MTPYEWLTRAVTAANQRESAAKDAARIASRSNLPPCLRELADAIEAVDRITRARIVMPGTLPTSANAG